MKFSIDKKTFGIGIVALSVIILGASFIYLLFNENLFISAVRKVIVVFKPVIFGFIMAYLMSSIVNFIEEKCLIPFYKRFHVTITRKVMSRMRGFSIIITLVFVFLFFYAFFMIVIPEIYENLQNFISLFPEYINNLSIFIQKLLVRYPEIEHYFSDVMNEYSGEFYEWFSGLLPSMNSFIKGLSLSVLGFLRTMWDLILGLIVAIYMLASKEKFIGQSKKILFSVFKKERANAILQDIRFIDKTFGGFIGGKLLDSLIIGILCFICLQFIGTPYSLLVSVIVGVTNVIPFFGPYIGAIPSAFIVLLVDPVQCLYFLIFILILQQFDGNFLGPLILGDSTGLSSFWVLFSITVFGGLFGVAGMIFGVPTFAVIYAYVKRFAKKRLGEKGYPIESTPYINLKEINEENTLIMMDETDEFYRISKETVETDYSGYKNIINDKKKENTKADKTEK